MPGAQGATQGLAVAGSDLQQDGFVQRGSKGVRVFDLLHHVRPHDAQPIRPFDRQHALEHAIDRAGLHARQQLAARIDQAHGLGTGCQHAHQTAAVGLDMRAQDRECIGRQAIGQRLHALR